MNGPVLRLDDARFGYGGVVAAHADLEIEAGEVVALLGSNGSGKSTLVKGALGLVDRYGGEVEWFGRNLEGSVDRSRIGYVPQRQPTTSPIPATLEEVVRTGRIARRGVVSRYRTADRRAVAAAISAVGLDGEARTPVRHLSGGQQRRALVARALAVECAALVLDEPFAGVDHESQDALAVTFCQLAAQGVTLIVILHELGSLQPVFTREVHMAAGEVVFDGHPSQRPSALGSLGAFDPHGDGRVELERPWLRLLP